MSNALFLTDTFNNPDFNKVLFANEFIRRGYQVAFASVNSLATNQDEHLAEVVWPTALLREGLPLQGDRPAVEPLAGFEIVWVMNQPHPAIANDVWQQLWSLGHKCSFVNSIEALTFLNNKNNLRHVVPQHWLPESWVSNNAGWLWNYVSAHADREFIAKPTNGGCGADVFRLTRDRVNGQAILQSLTGNEDTAHFMRDPAVVGHQRRYCVVQEYVPRAREGVTRVLVAGGELITSYERRPLASDHRSGGGELKRVDSLTAEEESMALEVADALQGCGVNFAGLDIVYPYLLELNLVNPGGIQNAPVSRLDYLVGKVLDAILGAVRSPSGVAHATARP
jgi:glutathione synthase